MVVHPTRQMVEAMFACVTSELTAPGVQFGSGNIAEPEPRAWHELGADLIGVVVAGFVVGVVEGGGAAVKVVEDGRHDVGVGKVEAVEALFPEFTPCGPLRSAGVIRTSSTRLSHPRS